MPPVPVLHVCDKFGVRGSSIHGVSRLFAWWFPRYDPARFQVTLCGLKAPEPASQKLAAEGVPVIHLGRGRFDARIVSDLVALGRRLGARLLHVHGYAAADFGRLAARALDARLVLHEHFADPRLPRYQAVADWLLRGLTDQAIAVSESTRTFLVQKRHVPAERVALIWNGAPLDEFAPVPRHEALALRRALGLPDDALVIGCVGRLSEQKGHRYLLDAFAQVAAELPSARLLIVGDGDLEASLRIQATALGVDARVCFAGHRSDVPRVLGALDVLAMASTYEGTPLALFEALAAGKAIVSTAVDGCAEILRHDETGLLVPARDPVALAQALLRVAREPELRSRLAAAARADSVRYDVRTGVAQMEAIYERLLARPRAA